jgi:hypothetical protein
MKPVNGNEIEDSADADGIKAYEIYEIIQGNEDDLDEDWLDRT